MKDFGQWLHEQSPPKPEPVAQSLNDQIEALGLSLMKDGGVLGECSRCGCSIRLTDYQTKDEILRDCEPSELFCGRSPRCCP